MKRITLLLFFLALLINFTSEEEKHTLVLNTDGSSIDDTSLSNKGINGVTEADKIVKISEPGTFVLQGDYLGQVKVELEDQKGEVTLILNGLVITNTAGPAILVTKANEIDKSDYSQQSPITYEKTKNLDFTNAGIKIIISDDTQNYVFGGHIDNYDAALHSTVSMVINGGEKGNGELTVIGDNEGISTDMHLQINGGVISVAGNDDAINGSKDFASAIIINGGKTIVNGGVPNGPEGDGIDSNGMIIVNGGTIIAAAVPQMDSGLDSNAGTIINGGIAIAVGSAMDFAENGCTQLTMNLAFTAEVTPKKVLTIEDSDGKEVVKFSPSDAGFVGSKIQGYKAMIISLPSFEMSKTYKLYLDGVPVAFTSKKRGRPDFGGFPGGQGGQGGFPWGGQGGQGGFPGGFPGREDDNVNDPDEGTARYEFTFTKEVENFSGMAPDS